MTDEVTLEKVALTNTTKSKSLIPTELEAEDEIKRWENAPLQLGKGKGRKSGHVKRSDGTVEPFLTGGYGHLLTKAESLLYPDGTDIPQSVIDAWWKVDYAEHKKAGERHAKMLNAPQLTGLLINASFQNGANWDKKHKQTWKLMKAAKTEEDWNEAADEVLRNKAGTGPSLWFEQTPTRAKAFSDALREYGRLVASTI